MAKRFVTTSVALLFVFGATSMTPRASAYCSGYGGALPSSATSWPVRIHAQMHNQMLHSDGTAWTRAELEAAVARTIARMNASAGADMPRLYLDNTTPASNCAFFDSNCGDGVPNPNLSVSCAIQGTIHIVPDNCGATWHSVGSQPDSDVIQIQVSSGFLGQFRWDSWFGGGAIFDDSIMHEGGHSVGLGHPNQCSDPNFSTICPTGAECAVMLGIGQNESGNAYYPDDQNGLQDIYGARPAPAETLLESSDLSSGVIGLGIGNIDLQGPVGASTRAQSSTAGTITIAGYSRLFTRSPVAVSWDFVSLGLTSLGLVNTDTSSGSVGSAQSSTTRYVTTSGARLSADSRRWNRRLVVSSRPTSGGSWSTTRSSPGSGATDDTRVAGVSSAYDAQSNTVLHAFRALNGRVLLQSINSSGTFSSFFDTGIVSQITPAIACTLETTGQNCLMVVSRPTRPATTNTSTVLQRVEFSWNHGTSSWSAGSLTTESWILVGDVQLSCYRRPSGAYEFVLSQLEQNTSGGTGVITFRKAPGSTNGFTLYGNLTSLTDTSFVVLGSTGDMEAFLFAQH